MKKTTAFAHHQAVGAYRRWEPPDFDAPPLPGSGAGTDAPEPVAPVPEGVPEPEAVQSPPVAESAPLPGLGLPTAAEIERIHEEARRTGFDEGSAEGREQGRAEGYEAGFAEGRESGFGQGKSAAEAEARQLHDLAAQLGQALARIDGEVAEELVSLAIELARKVLQHTLAVEPEAIVSVIRVVLQTLPQTRTEISLNPEDLALVHKHLGELVKQGGHLLIGDETVTRGGCRVETPGAQIDATMETRWRRALESLGQEHAPWAAPAASAQKARAGTRASRKEPAAREGVPECAP